MKELLGSTWLEINLDAVKYNIQNIRKLIGEKIKIMGIVKGNGYGHDAIEISKIIVQNGVDQLAVARVEEAIILRKHKIKVPILVLGMPLEEQFHLFLDYQVMPTVCNLASIIKFNDLAAQLKKKLKVHLKIDTGMGRLGIKAQEINYFISQLQKLSYIELAGVYTHFSTADESSKDYTIYQFNLFKQVINYIKTINIKPEPIFHIANSGAILDLPETWLDMVRPGCLIYGLYPSVEVKRTINLLPVLTFKTRISFIKKVPFGQYIGYGKTYQTKRETTIATLPAGYADGYSRILSNLGKVLIKSKQIPVIGRICMDQMMIDITELNKVTIGEEVVLWGRNGIEHIPVEDIAQELNTIVDEVVHLTDKARVAKLFIKDGKPWKIKNILGEYYCEK